MGKLAVFPLVVLCAFLAACASEPGSVEVTRIVTEFEEIQVNAALAGHDLGPFEPVETFEGAGYQAECRKCELTAWVGESGLMCSLLDEPCSKKP